MQFRSEKLTLRNFEISHFVVLANGWLVDWIKCRFHNLVICVQVNGTRNSCGAIYRIVIIYIVIEVDCNDTFC